MPGWNGHEAWITVDGEKVQEFEVEVDAPEPARAREDPVVVSCWIPSELGKSFQVHFRTGIITKSGCHLYLDGQYCRGKYKKEFARDPQQMFRFTGMATGRSTERPFIYSRPPTTDEEGLGIQHASDTQGTIAVYAHELKFTSKARQKIRYHEVPQQQVLNERSKKAIDHGVAYGAPERASAQTSRTRTTRITRKVVNFIFKYRPIDVLRANGIAPTLPRIIISRDNPEVIEISDDEDPPEERVLQEQLARLEREAESTRKQMAALQGAGDRRSKRVKTEHASVKTEGGSSSSR